MGGQVETSCVDSWTTSSGRSDMESHARRRGQIASSLLFVVLMLFSTWSREAECQVLFDYTPKSGPVAGGTVINVTGAGFIITGADRSKCRFELAARGAMLSYENLIHNGTFLTCILPEIAFLSDSMLQRGNRMTQLRITGDSGSVSNGVEFFLYDLERIRIEKIFPAEGLANSSNITLSITGENFLDTNELTCSVVGSYQVSAQYINSSLLQCQLSPFPETAQVSFDVSMNGQAIANIPPLTNSSTTFTYFASPPRIQSCRFTLSYAQLLLSFDREAEIGGEERVNGTLPALSCSAIFARETLRNVIGLNSTCFWYNTQQREVVVQLSSDTSVQLRSQITVRNDTIRTRYVRYSRLASGSTTVSLPEMDSSQFLPMAVIEAPSLIPYCGNFTVSGAKSQYGGSQGLQYKWIIGTHYDENGTLIQDRILADHLPKGFTTRSVLELSSDLFNPDLLGSGSGSGAPLTLASRFDIQLHVRNFLGFTSMARVVNVSRAEVPQPDVLIVGGDARRVRVSDETMLQGRVIFPSDTCLMSVHDFSQVVSYTWTIVDQSSGRAVNLDDITHSTDLVLPPYSLELGSEYTATLSVDFGSIIVEASVTLMTDIEQFNLVARISGGTRRSVGMSEAILLDGRQSQYVNTSLFVLDIAWSCIVVASNEDCRRQNGQYLSFSTDNLLQVIPSGTLQPGEYNFTLTLTLTSASRDTVTLEISAYQVVVVFPFSVPTVEILQGRLDLESILVHNELILNIGVQSNSLGIGQWTLEYVIGECCGKN